MWQEFGLDRWANAFPNPNRSSAICLNYTLKSIEISILVRLGGWMADNSNPYS
jgi:hypothetical protein